MSAHGQAHKLSVIRPLSDRAEDAFTAPTRMSTSIPSPGSPIEHIVLDESSDVLADLVARAIGQDTDATARLVAALQAHGLSPATIFLDHFEPAARRLGDLWQDDQCSEFDITVALGRLQTLTRELGDDFQFGGPRPTQRRSALVATQPGERHMLGLALSSEHFWRAGWDVTCAFPESDQELGRLLHDQSFDVVDLSLSSVFRRDHRLAAMGASVRNARALSLNRALVVLVSGRLFFDRPELGVLIGADAAYRSAARAVPLAATLTQAQFAGDFRLAQGTLQELGERVAAKAWRNPVAWAA